MTGLDKATPTPKAILRDGWLIPDGLDERMVQDVVHGFYDEIHKDALLGPIFVAAIPAERWAAHLSKMCDFWASMVLRSSRYDGKLMQPHLQLDGLGDEHLLRWLTLFRNTVRRICPPGAASLFMDRAVRITHGVRLAIARSREEDTAGIGPLLECDLETE